MPPTASPLGAYNALTHPALPGNAILREIDVSHPAAKSMIELSRSQDEEVGDGTTSVIILAGELLYQAEPFLLRQMHPTVIVRAFHRAMEAALAICDEMAVDVDTDNPAEMRAIIRSCLGTKMVSRYGDLMCDLAMQAVSTVSVTRADGTKDINLKHFARVEKVRGAFCVCVWAAVGHALPSPLLVFILTRAPVVSRCVLPCSYCFTWFCSCREVSWRTAAS